MKPGIFSMKTILILIIFTIYHRGHHYYRHTPTWHHPNKATSGRQPHPPHKHDQGRSRSRVVLAVKASVLPGSSTTYSTFALLPKYFGILQCTWVEPYIVFYKIKYSNYFPTAMCCFLVHLLSTNISIGTNEELPPATVKISFNQDSVLNLWLIYSTKQTCH